MKKNNVIFSGMIFGNALLIGDTPSPSPTIFFINGGTAFSVDALEINGGTAFSVDTLEFDHGDSSTEY